MRDAAANSVLFVVTKKQISWSVLKKRYIQVNTSSTTVG